MRASCVAQDIVVLRPIQTRRGGTSTARLKTGAEQFYWLATSSARQVFRPTNEAPLAHAPFRHSSRLREKKDATAAHLRHISYNGASEP
jgi:hypothetical protein